MTGWYVPVSKWPVRHTQLQFLKQPVKRNIREGSWMLVVKAALLSFLNASWEGTTNAHLKKVARFCMHRQDGGPGGSLVEGGFCTSKSTGQNIPVTDINLARVWQGLRMIFVVLKSYQMATLDSRGHALGPGCFLNGWTPKGPEPKGEGVNRPSSKKTHAGVQAGVQVHRYLQNRASWELLVWYA